MEYVFINNGVSDPSLNPLQFDRELSIKYKTILDYIVSENGYTKSGAVFNDTTLNLLYLTSLGYTDLGYNTYNEKFFPSKQFEAERDTTVNANVTNSYLKINFTKVISNGGFYNGTNTFSVVDTVFGGAYFYFNAYATIVISNIVFAGGATRLAIRLFSSSGSYLLNNITGPGTYLLELSDSIGFDPSGNPVSKVVGIDGQQVYVEARTLDPIGTPTGSATVTFSTGTVFKNRVLAEIPQPTLHINVGGVLPDLSQKDFFKDFAVRTGTFFRETPDKILVCKTLEEIINDRVNARNWTGKRDPGVQEGIQYRFRAYSQNNYFKYNIGDQFSTENIGEGNLIINSGSLDPKRTIYTSPFKNASTSKFGNSTAGFITCARILSVDDDGNRADPGLHLVAVRNKRSFEPGIGAGGLITNYKVGYFEDVDNIEPADATFKNALKVMYPSLTNALQKAKLITRNYKLTEEDIAALDLFQLVFDEGVYYLVNSVKNYIGDDTESTSVELFKVS